MGYVAWNYISLSQMPGIGEFFRAIFLLKDTFFPALWFIRDFMLAYLIISLNRAANVTMRLVVLEIAILLMFSEIWIAICLIGSIVVLLEQTDYRLLREHRMAQILFLVLALGLTKLPIETNEAFIAYGLSCMMIILVINVNGTVCSLFNFRGIAWAGRYSWGFFLVHVLVYDIIGTKIFNLDQYMGADGYGQRFLSCFLLCTLCNIVLSVPVSCAIEKVASMFEKMVIRGIEYISVRV